MSNLYNKKTDGITGAPIALNPQNSRYFIYNGESTILITSGEHYGAVMNMAFDYDVYLDTLRSYGFNLTRLFTGVYREFVGAYSIEGNTLAPENDDFICPWKRTDISGALDGGNKFDLDTWDGDYFARLKDFCQKAYDRDIIVEIPLFCPFYSGDPRVIDKNWEVSPLHYGNNINSLDEIKPNEAYTLKSEKLTEYQKKLTIKIVSELNDFDNIYYEPCNEPYFDGVRDEWQDFIINTIVDTEKALPKKHLIAQDICNGYEIITNYNKNVSVFNFHYAGGETAKKNLGLKLPVGCNETGLRTDFDYSKQAWEMLMSGGAIYNNLDFSFACGHEKGTFSYHESQPGGGDEQTRQRMKILKDFMYSFDFENMEPSDEFIKRLFVMNGRAYVMQEPSKAYAAYIQADIIVDLLIDLPKGEYRLEYINTLSGEIDFSCEIISRGGILSVAKEVISKGMDTDISKSRSGDFAFRITEKSYAKKYIRK